jgi:hypothetical protein
VAKLALGDTVFVPSSRLSLEAHPFAMYETRVQEVGGRSVRVRLPNGTQSVPVGSALVHKNVGLAILAIGDFQTEATLISPLAKSIHEYGRLLFHDSMVVRERFRSVSELVKWWAGNHKAHSHVVLIGHGRRDGLRFGVDGWKTAAELGSQLATEPRHRKAIISLSCETGYAAFGQVLSRQPLCRDFIGPFGAVHGAIASQFCQTFLANHFLEGQTTAVAFRRARLAVPGGRSFRLWRKGDLKERAGATD